MGLQAGSCVHFVHTNIFVSISDGLVLSRYIFILHQVLRMGDDGTAGKYPKFSRDG